MFRSMMLLHVMLSAYDIMLSNCESGPLIAAKLNIFVVFRQNFGSADTTFCGVFDGHGPFGHVVAKKVRDALPLRLTSQWVLNGNARNGPADDSSEAVAYHEGKDEERCDLFMTLKDSFLKAFKVMDKELKLHPRIDCYCSGTTAVTLVKQVGFLRSVTRSSY